MLRKWNILAPDVTASAEGGRMRVRAVASSTVRDRHGDTFTEKALREMEAQSLGLNIFLNHSWTLPEDLAGKVVGAELRRSADGVYELIHDIEINAANDRAVQTWRAIENGAQLGMSIEAMIPEGAASRDKKTGGFLFDAVDLMGSSFVAHPANTRSWTEYAVKSLTGHLPDKLREMEERLGRDFYLTRSDDADAPIIIESDEPETVESDEPADLVADEPIVVDEAAPTLDEDHPVLAVGEPDATESAVTIVGPDGTTVMVDLDASQGDPDEGPDKGLDALEDDNGLENEELLGDDVTKSMTALGPTITAAFDGQQMLIRTLTDEVVMLRTALTQATTEKDAAIELAKRAIADAESVVNRLLDSPMGRRTVVRDASENVDHLKSVYGDDILAALAAAPKQR